MADAQALGPKAACCPYSEGQKLWVRETFVYTGPGSGSDLPTYVEERTKQANQTPANCWYRATSGDAPIRWTPAIHMPRWASRITLEVTGVRVERLQDISEDDAWAEGCRSDATWALDWYVRLWDSLNAARGYGWDVNPWVWVVNFRIVK